MTKTIPTRLGIALLSLLATTASHAACTVDLVGTWKQVRVDYSGYVVDDDTQSWVFKQDGTVRFIKTKPAIDVQSKFGCERDLVTTDGTVSGRIRVVNLGGGMMGFELLDKGGGVAHVTRTP